MAAINLGMKRRFNKNSSPVPKFVCQIKRVALAVSLALASPTPWALPAGGSVAAGAVNIQQPSSSSLNIGQTSNQAVVNWQSFNIGQGEAVRIQQPSPQAVLLNRVVGEDASSIFGQLSANGRVFLVNPAGILFGPDARVDVGSLTASTLKISDGDFLAGRYIFTGGEQGGQVVNAGTLRASQGGYIALLGHQVVNSGNISAPGGSVALAAGDQIEIDLNGDGLLALKVNAAALDAKVSHSGVIDAEGGSVALSAHAKNALVDTVLNVSGTIKATGISKRNGEIYLDGGDSGVVEVSGSLDVSSHAQAVEAPATQHTGTGGNIAVTGGQINLTASASLDASGDTAGGTVTLAATNTPLPSGGGSGGEGIINQGGTIHADSSAGAGGQVILSGNKLQLDTGSLTTATGATGGGQIYVGGGPHGSPLPPINGPQSISPLPPGEGPGVRVQNATTARVEQGATLDASATNNGNGGTIVAYASKQTYFAGTAKAEGGPNGGDGGSIETSGSQLNISDSAQVSTLAPLGKTGTWLLDPNDYTIAASGGNITGTALSANLGTSNVTISTATQGTAGGNGDIFVNDTVSWTSNTTLSLQAGRNIQVDTSISATGNTAGLTLGYGPAAGNGYFLNSAATINLPGTAPVLKIGVAGSEASYTVINSLGVAGDTSGTSLQGMQGNLAKNYALGSNIDASATSTWNVSGGVAAGFNPVGNNVSSTFTGRFDGLGHVINGLSINRPTTSNVGLFGYSSGSISNAGSAGGSVTGLGSVGGLVGYNNGGTLSNVYNTGGVIGFSEVGGLVGINVVSAHISNAYSTGTVSGTTDVGGLVGVNINSSLSNVYSTGPVSGSGPVGGLVGYNYSNIAGNSIIQNAYSTSAVSGFSSSYTEYVGGLAGRNNTNSTISNTYSTGKVSDSGSSGNVGGLVGANTGTVTASFWDTQTSAQASSAGGIGMTTAQMMTQANFTSATTANGNVNPNWNFSTGWWMSDGNTRPFLLSEYSTTITNAHQLQLMATNLGANYTLANDINMSELQSTAGLWSTATGFVPIGNATTAFGGSFNGGGHVITGLTINRPTTDNIGLFGLSSGTISNIGIVGGSVIGQNTVGGLVGASSNGAISNSYSSAQVNGVNDVGGLVGYNNLNTIRNTYSTGAISGKSTVGGLVGLNSSIVSNSYSTGAVSGNSSVGGLVGVNAGNVTKTYSTGTVSGNTYVGGLVGFASYGTISNAYSTGAVSGNSSVGGLIGQIGSLGNIINTYSTGAVSGNSSVGGLVGYNSNTIYDSYSTGLVSATGSGPNAIGGLVGSNTGTVFVSFWDTQTSGLASSAGGTGLTTAQMMTQANFSGWDFTTIWGMIPNVSYPYLQWQFATAPQIVSGILSGAGNSGKTIQIAQNGSLLTTASTGADGFYYLTLSANSIASGHDLLSYLSSAGSTPAATVRLSDGNSLTGINLTPNTLTVGSNSAAAVSNTDIATAKGSLSSADIPYTVSGSNISLTSGVAFQTASGTNYNLNGNLTTVNASLNLSSAGLLALGSYNLSGTGVTLGGLGVTSTGGTVNGGSGDVLINAGGGAFNLAGAITTTSNTATAVKLLNASTAALGNISTGATGTTTLGVAGNTISGAVTQTGSINTGTLVGVTGNTVNLSGSNTLTNLGSFTSGGAFTLSDSSGGLNLTGALNSGSATVSITTTGGVLALGSNNIGAVGVTLKGAGVTSAGGTVNGGSGDVLINAGGGAVNLAGALSTTSNSATAVQVINASTAALGNISTGATGTTTLGVAGNTISGAVTQTGILNIGTLAGLTGSTVSLGGNNTIANLGAFTSNGAFTLNDTTGLNVTGAVMTSNNGAASVAVTGGNLAITTGSVAGAGINLSTTGTGNAMTLNGNINGNAGNVVLISADAISQTGGAINTTATLSGSASTTVTLSQANTVANLGAFTTNGDFSLTNGNHLTVVGIVGSGSLGNVSLNITGGVGENAGAGITGAGLQLLGTGNFALYAENQVNTIATDTSGSLIGFGNNSNLTVGTVHSTQGITTHDQTLELDIRGDLSITANVNTGSSGVLLSTTGGISQTNTGLIIGDFLIGHAGSTMILDQANAIAQIGKSYGLTSQGDFILHDSSVGGLAVTGSVNSTTGLVSVSNTGGNLTVDATGSNTGSVTGNNVTLATVAGGDIILQGQNAKVDGGTESVNLLAAGSISQTGGQIVTNGGTVTLTASTGSIDQTGGVVTTGATGTLSGSAATTVTLNQANTVANLGSFTSNGAFTLNDTTALNVTGAVGTSNNGAASLFVTGGNLAITTGSVAGAGASLTTTGAGNAIRLNGNINGNAGNVVLTSADAISQTGGAINTTGTLSGSAAATVTLNQANTVANLGSFTSNGAFALNDSTGLNVTGAVSTGNNGVATLLVTGGNLAVTTGTLAGAGVNLTTTGAGNAIRLNGSVNGNTGNINLNSADAISQTENGLISTTGTLSGSAAATVTLNQANTIANLGAFASKGAFTLNDTTGLNVIGTVTTNNNGAASIAVTGGNLAVTTGTLAGAGVNLTTTGAGNAIILNGNVNGNAGNVALNSADLISINNAIYWSGDTSLSLEEIGRAHV